MSEHNREIIVLVCRFPEILRASAVGEVIEVSDYRETVILELLVLVFDEAQRHFADERCPAAIRAPRPQDPVTKRKRIQVENVTRRLFAKAVALAAVKDVRTERLVAADEERHTLVSIEVLDL